ncbi:gliding-associated putative ABC transporter substrate-binding component GldG [Marivirga sericea]|uniref:Gliding-associated putative ABC transporter substrate-binding component GldG n=1 Tax=Marivirga sericea TaxID=1028 RepID=A0A1X7JHS9_9BACT|nr:gliding motility-associated ABC transporter substrate-binding protein GldG [Marivirga sericea]SMG27640.1 gliding-associated putative ABC transporter substrate-binding component GldG [Marivirga sericea]
MEFLKRKSTEHTLKFFIIVMVVILVNLVFRHQIFRYDMTEEKRYSMNQATISMLQNLDEPVYVEVYLAGDINAEFTRLQTAIKQTLEQFKTYAYGNLQYSFINPDEANSANSRNEFYRYLIDKGIQPTTVFDNSDGKKSQKLIFPGAEISYGERSMPVILLNGNNAAGAGQAITQSIETLEYELASTIKSLSTKERKRIALFQGSGSPSGNVLKGLNDAVTSKYDLILVQNTDRITQFDATIFLKPTEDFSNGELYDIDQYIMNGGKSLFFLDGLKMDVDSIKEYGAMALPVETGLADLLFKYGVRVNNDVLQDVNSGNFPIVTGNLGKDPQIQLLPWPYYIILNKYADHPIVRNMNAVYGKFVSSIDTVASSGIQKTPLIFTSDYTRKLKGPIHISFENLKQEMKPENFDLKNVPVTYLLEGKFNSAYQNRLPPKGKNAAKRKDRSSENSIIVASDGDLLLSEINKKNNQPFPLGVDPYANHPSNFANDQLIFNMLNYLLDEDGLIISRNKELKIRPLDKVKVADDKLWLQLVNVALPIILIVLFGILRNYWRKRKYARFNG